MSKSHIEIIEAANSPSRPGTQMPAELVREDTTWFLWNGAALLAEGKGDASGPVDPLATVYAYEPASFRPAAQIRRVDPEAEAQILIYWLDHLGTPQELSNENGELVWQVALKAWGGVGRTFVERVPQNLRFQGQYYDDETGLHYNRFRHYDPAAGCFINPDPIGLLGGFRPFAYPANPLVWIDPLGLMCGTNADPPDAPNGSRDPRLPKNGVDYDGISTANAAKGQSATPRDLNEQILMNIAKNNPSTGKPLPHLSGDPRFNPSDGFTKMEMSHKLPDGTNITTHYQYNSHTGRAYDVKIVTPQRVPPTLQPGPSIIGD